ncbi:MAG: hemolysin family protein [Anaerovoracaceae bacterium]|jgi:putative hemolysin
MKGDPDYLLREIFIAAACILVMLFIGLMGDAMDTVSASKIRSLDDEIYDGRKKRLLGLLDKPYKHKVTDQLLRLAFFSAGLTALLVVDYRNIYYKLLAAVIYVAAAVSFGAIFPMKTATQHAEGLALSLSGLQKALDVVFTPLTVLLTGIADIFLKIFGQSTAAMQREFSEDDVMQMLEVGQKSGQINEEGRKMIGSIFRFDDELAYEIMTPRTDVFMIDINDPQDEYLDDVMSLRYSRIPVCEGDIDNIIGILNIKDYLIKARQEGFGSVDIRAILRKPYLVPETKNIDSLFMEMREDKQHISVLIDEYGGFSGIVTMEDIIEEIVGDIDDEYDVEDEVIEQTGENEYVADGSVPLDDINSTLGTDLESETSETVGGFIIDLMGEIPGPANIGKEIRFENISFYVLSVKDRRIEQVRIVLHGDDESAGDEAEDASAPEDGDVAAGGD